MSKLNRNDIFEVIANLAVVVVIVSALIVS